MSADAGFGERLESHTDAYLDGISDCVKLLPELLAQYEADGAYRETLAEIQTVESECDERNRTITALITNADAESVGLLNTRINFNESALLEFYKSVDVVANLTERIAQELVMIQPPHDTDCFATLTEMAEQIASMTATLEDVIERFVHSLCNAYESDTLTDEIEAVRGMESRCDELRNDVITTAFRDDETDQALMYREFAILFDELANTMEDLTDQIVIIASKEPGIVTDPELDT